MESAASALPCGCSPRRPVLKVHPRRGMHQNLTSTCAYGPHLVFPFIWKTGWFLPSETGLYDSSVSIKCLLCARHDASRKKRFIFLFFFLDYKGKSSTPFSERVFSCRVCGPAVRACCGAATMEAGAQGTVARSFGGDTQLWIATRLRKEQH